MIHDDGPRAYRFEMSVAGGPWRESVALTHPDHKYGDCGWIAVREVRPLYRADQLTDEPRKVMADGGQPTSDDRVRYLRNNELRAEIVAAVGGDPARYQQDDTIHLQKADLVRVADTLQPDDDETKVCALTLGALYEEICRWAGGEYDANAGRPWGITRENLKAIHRAVDGRPPQEVPA